MKWRCSSIAGCSHRRKARRRHRLATAGCCAQETVNRDRPRRGGIAVRARSGEVEPREMVLAQKRNAIVVRAHLAAQVAQTEPSWIKQRAQIRFAILRVERFGGCKLSGSVFPVCKRRTAQVTADFFECRPDRQHTLALHQHEGTIEIVDAIKWREPADGKMPVGPEHGKFCTPIGRQRGCLPTQAIDRLRGQVASVTTAMSYRCSAG